MNKRVSKKIYRRTALKGALPWGSGLTDRERLAHRIWWRVYEMFRVEVQDYTGFIGQEDLLNEYAKNVEKILNKARFKSIYANLVIDYQLFGGAAVVFDSPQK